MWYNVNMENKQTYSRDEILERLWKAIEDTMEGNDLARICNEEFGMGISYVEDDLFEDEEE